MMLKKLIENIYRRLYKQEIPDNWKNVFSVTLEHKIKALSSYMHTANPHAMGKIDAYNEMLELIGIVGKYDLRKYITTYNLSHKGGVLTEDHSAEEWKSIKKEKRRK